MQQSSSQSLIPKIQNNLCSQDSQYLNLEDIEQVQTQIQMKKTTSCSFKEINEEFVQMIKLSDAELLDIHEVLMEREQEKRHESITVQSLTYLRLLEQYLKSLGKQDKLQSPIHHTKRKPSF